MRLLGIDDAQGDQEYHLGHHHGILQKIKPRVSIGDKITYANGITVNKKMIMACH